MALSLELACSVLTLDSGSRAETAAQRIKPDLLILDEVTAALPSDLAEVPTLLINVAVPSQSQSYPTLFLSTSWKIEELYAAVHALLGHPS